ncbi:LysR family transcriptional regulator [Streptomyces sp. NPDC006645]|uniref:LysR family transcriptional regulator n=1 Tax=unclassified Streptomyces TaxID=2593676 RepID=UPI0033A8AA0F
MDIELRHARIVVTVHAAGSISRAAGELNLPQPSLTAQLQRIEKAVGGELFVRSRTGVTLTDLGMLLIPRFTDLVWRADDVMAVASAASAQPLRLGNTEWTPPKLREALRAALSDTVVRTETLAPDAAVAALRQGTLSAALVHAVGPTSAVGVDEPGLGRVLIVREPVRAALAHSHPWTGRDSVDVAHLVRLPWVLHSSTHWFRAVEEALLSGAGRPAPADVLHQVNSQREAMKWVHDMGVVALTTPSGVIDGVTAVPLTSTAHVEMALIWRRGSMPERTLRQLVETVRAYYRAYDPAQPAQPAPRTGRLAV